MLLDWENLTRRPDLLGDDIMMADWLVVKVICEVWEIAWCFFFFYLSTDFHLSIVLEKSRHAKENQDGRHQASISNALREQH